MTNNQKLKELVERGIENKWLPKKIGDLSFEEFRIPSKSVTFIYRTGKSKLYRDYSLPDLIAEDGFMKAIYGEELVCARDEGKSVAESCRDYCGISRIYHHDQCEGGGSMERFEYIKSVAINKKDKIEYLYNEMKRGVK
jgi:hypothetical protein